MQKQLSPEEWREVYESDEMKEIIFEAVQKLFREESLHIPGTTNQPEGTSPELHQSAHNNGS